VFSPPVPCVSQQKKQCAPVLEQNLSAGKPPSQSKEPIPKDKISPNKAEQPTHGKAGTDFASHNLVTFAANKSCPSMHRFVISITNFNDAFGCVKDVFAVRLLWAHILVLEINTCTHFDRYVFADRKRLTFFYVSRIRGI